MNPKTNLLTAGLLACGLLLFAAFNYPGEKPDFNATVAPIIEMSKQHTLEVLDAMPEDNFGYKPTEISKTFGGQMYHIGYTLKFFTHAMLKGEEMNYEEADASTMTKAELREMVAASYDELAMTVEGMGEEMLMEEIPFGPDKKITREQAVLFALDHSTNHRAKANLYIRMNDMEPPHYKFM